MLQVINRGLVRVLDEDFDDVPLRPVEPPSPNVNAFGGQAVWSPDFPEGWVSDRSLMPADALDGGVEFFGWTVFGSVPLWAFSETLAGNTRNARGVNLRIDLGVNLINSFAVSDSDINESGTRAILTTPTVEIPANTPSFLSFVNSYNHFSNSIGDVDVVFHGGGPILDLVDFTVDSFGLVSYPLPVSTSAQTVSIIFDYRSTLPDEVEPGQFQNRNDWWWAFDQIRIEYEDNPRNSVHKSWEIYE